MDEDVDKEFHILPMSPIPHEAWQFISEMEAAVREASGFNKTIVGHHVEEEHNQHGKA